MTIDDNRIDALREISSIGSGNAVTSLSEILSKKIEISVVGADMIEISKISQLFQPQDDPVISVLIKVFGDINGHILFTVDLESAKEFCRFMFNEQNMSDYAQEKVDGLIKISDMEFSMISEIANILASTYLASICKMTGFSIRPKEPLITVDMAGCILSILAGEVGRFNERALFLKAEFEQKDLDIKGTFFLVPDEASYEKLLGALGV